MNTLYEEIQIDSLIAPTHHYGGLAYGNVASMSHAGQVSHPRAAALQGIAKMRAVMEAGIVQAVLPPLLRPDTCFLHACGFSECPEDSVQQAQCADPYLLRLAYSSASTWAANCATVIPSTDSSDNRCHIIPANLLATPHRALEAHPRYHMLKRCFAADEFFCVHEPLPTSTALADEGAANHHRFVDEEGNGVHLFVANRSAWECGHTAFPARQSSAAQECHRRLSGLQKYVQATILPEAVEVGAFHNDVIMAATDTMLLLHQSAWRDQSSIIQQLLTFLPHLKVREVSQSELPLSEAISSYLFNSQFLTTDKGVLMIAPQQCAEGRAKTLCESLQSSGIVQKIIYQPLDESMHNGGGPACLRLRVSLNKSEQAAMHQGIILTKKRLADVEELVRSEYREELSLDDLGDPDVAKKSLRTIAALHTFFGLEHI